MLAKKFLLLLEMLKTRTYGDGSPREVSTSRHVPIELPPDMNGCMIYHVIRPLAVGKP
jgi:hypothetical protein